jgi:hypothetical protein
LATRAKWSFSHSKPSFFLLLVSSFLDLHPDFSRFFLRHHWLAKLIFSWRNQTFVFALIFGLLISVLLLSLLVSEVEFLSVKPNFCHRFSLAL